MLDLPFEMEALLVFTEEEARHRLAVTPAQFRGLCASGRLIPVRAENGQGVYAREDVMRLQRLLDRARRLERARRVHDPVLTERARTWSDHLRHEGRIVRERAAGADGETLAAALEAAARVIDRALAE